MLNPKKDNLAYGFLKPEYPFKHPFESQIKFDPFCLHWSCSPSTLLTAGIRRREQSRGATKMQAKWIKLDLIKSFIVELLIGKDKFKRKTNFLLYFARICLSLVYTLIKSHYQHVTINIKLYVTACYHKFHCVILFNLRL